MPERRFEWFPVARWEFSRIVRRADFIISVLLTPALIFLVPLLIGQVGAGKIREVAVVRVDAGGRIQARGEAALPPLPGFHWCDPGPAGADTTALAAALRAKAFEAAFVLPADAGTQPAVVNQVTPRAPSRWVAGVHALIESELRRERLASLGLSGEQLAALEDSVVFRRHSALGPAAGNRRADFLVTFGMLLLTILVIFSGVSYLMVGISGEKAARVTEVVVSAIPAQAWMDGKLVAFTAVGLLTGVIWAAAVVLMAGSVGFALPGSVNPVNLAITAVFAVLGLYLYNALLAALMASAQSLQSSSKWQGNFLALPFIPFLFIGMLLDRPDSPWMAGLSQFPFFASIMIPTRLVLNGVRAWEIVLALVLLLAACWFMRRVAGRVFRLGMLMYGKDMTLPELIRWARVK